MHGTHTVPSPRFLLFLPSLVSTLSEFTQSMSNAWFSSALRSYIDLGFRKYVTNRAGLFITPVTYCGHC
jgi:hypothetical protein